MHPGKMKPNRIRLIDLFKYYKALPHQSAAVSELEELIEKASPDILVRTADWFNTWSQSGKQCDYSSGIQLIKEFEGCHLSAYPDPLTKAEPWTIGYGTTRYAPGSPVKRGDKVNVIEADMLLRLEVDRIVAKLSKEVPYWQQMSDEQMSALISFAYNLGSGFYGANNFETITSCLKNKKWLDVPAAFELYRNPGTHVEAGLLRRRKAEGALWLSGVSETFDSEQQPSKVKPRSPFAVRLTPHIRLGEFALDREERRFDYQYQVDTAGELAAFLERARNVFGGKPVIITSGYRNPHINQMVNGASSSEHLFSGPGIGAVDWFIEGVDIYKLQEWCLKEWPYSTGKGAPKGFIHTGIRQDRPRIQWDY